MKVFIVGHNESSAAALAARVKAAGDEPTWDTRGAEAVACTPQRRPRMIETRLPFWEDKMAENGKDTAGFYQRPDEELIRDFPMLKRRMPKSASTEELDEIIYGPPQPATDTNFATGAIRSADANELRFDLIHPVALIALAKTYAEGAAKYGDENYARGMPVHDLLNHVLRHIVMYLAGDRSEPHLPHAAWGILTAIVSDTLWPELNAPHLRGPGCTLTPGILERQRQEDEKCREFRKSEAGKALGQWTLDQLPEIQRILEQRAQAGS